MATKKNFLGGQQNYNQKTGEYEPSLVGPSGKVVTDADGDGIKHESKSKDQEFIGKYKGEKGSHRGWTDIDKDEPEIQNGMVLMYESKEKALAAQEQLKKDGVEVVEVKEEYLNPNDKNPKYTVYTKESQRPQEHDFNDPEEAAGNLAEEKDFNLPKKDAEKGVKDEKEASKSFAKEKEYFKGDSLKTEIEKGDWVNVDSGLNPSDYGFADDGPEYSGYEDVAVDVKKTKDGKYGLWMYRETENGPLADEHPMDNEPTHTFDTYEEMKEFIDNGYKMPNKATIETNKKPEEWKFDQAKYPEAKKTPYGFIYNAYGHSITDVAGQNKAFGEPVEEGKNYGYLLEVNGDESYYDSFDEAYNRAKELSQPKAPKFKQPTQEGLEEDLYQIMDKQPHGYRVTDLKNGKFDIFNKNLYDDKEANEEVANILKEKGYDAKLGYDRAYDSYFITVKSKK